MEDEVAEVSRGDTSTSRVMEGRVPESANGGTLISISHEKMSNAITLNRRSAEGTAYLAAAVSGSGRGRAAHKF